MDEDISDVRLYIRDVFSAFASFKTSEQLSCCNSSFETQGNHDSLLRFTQSAEVAMLLVEGSESGEGNP